MSCGISRGLTINCNDLRRVGGVKKRAWWFNLDEVTYTIDGDGYVTEINFGTYEGLYAINARKQSHSGGSTLVKQEPGGNTFYTHDVILKVFPITPEDDDVIESLAVAEGGIILETNNNEFILYGAYNGMEQTAGVQNTGQAPASDIATTLTFSGSEQGVPLRILDTNYTTTLALLESYEV